MDSDNIIGLILFVLIILLQVMSVSALTMDNLRTITSQYTHLPDWIRTSNFTGENITADYIFGYLDNFTEQLDENRSKNVVFGENITVNDCVIYGTTAFCEKTAGLRVKVGDGTNDFQMGQGYNVNYVAIGRGDQDFSTFAGTPISFRNSGSLYLNSVGAGYVLISKDGVSVAEFRHNQFWSKQLIRTDAGLRMLEQATAPPDFATFGHLWVKDNTPNELMFSDDADNDYSVSPDYVGKSINVSENISLNNSIIFPDSDKGLEFWSGSNLLMTVRRWSAGLPTRAGLWFAGTTDFVVAGAQKLTLSTTTLTSWVVIIGSKYWHQSGDMGALDGNIFLGAGADMAMGYNGSDGIIDPDRVGSGSLWIGLTGDDNLYANDITALGNTTSAGYYDSSLVGYWQGTNNQSNDSSMYGNDGTFEGNAHSQKDVFELDGTNDYITLSSTIVLSDDWSVSSWVNLKDSGKIVDSLMGSPGNADAYIAFRPTLNDIYMETNTNLDGVGICNDVLTFNEWSHYTIVSISDTISCYKDGVFVDSDTLPTGDDLDIEWIGRGYYVIANAEFNGSLDEVKIYDRALSQAEILKIYNEQSKNYGYFNEIEVTGNITSENVFLPAYISSHTNNTIPVDVAGVFYNVTFDHEEDEIKERVTHNFDDNTNYTFTIVDDGIYEITYSATFQDSAVVPTSHVVTRVTKNNIELNGFTQEEDLGIKDQDKTIAHSDLVSLSTGDTIELQFTSSDTTVSLIGHLTYGTHLNTGHINIKKKYRKPG